MGSGAAARWSPRPKREDEESTASGIYGTIVSAAVMASSHADTAGTVIAGVAVTLVVYWAAERYARLVAQRIHEDRKPTWREVGRQMGQGWEIVTASALPLGVLAAMTVVAPTSPPQCSRPWRAARCCCASPAGRSATALACLLLERTVLVAIAGGFGGLMIVLKALLH